MLNGAPSATNNERREDHIERSNRLSSRPSLAANSGRVCAIVMEWAEKVVYGILRVAQSLAPLKIVLLSRMVSDKRLAEERLSDDWGQ